MKFKRVIALILSVMMVFSLAACGDKETTATTPSASGTTTTATTPSGTASTTTAPTSDATEYQEEIIIATSGEFTSQDPMKTSASLDQLIQNLVYFGLSWTDPATQAWACWGAKEISMIEPDLWQLKLREDITFTDGTVMNADDVIFTWQRGLENPEYCSWASEIEELEKVDDYTINYHLFAPNLDYKYKFGNDSMAVLSKEAFDSMPEEEAVLVGNGPWMWEEVVPGDYVSLVRNENYTAGPVVNTKRLVFKYMPEASARLIALQTGEIDVCMNPSAVDYQTIADDSNLQLLQIPTRGHRALAFNVNADNPVSDPLVRKAIASAINRADIMAVATGGYGEPSYNVSPTTSDYYTEIEGIPEDVEAAKKFLAEAGYPDGFTVTLTHRSSAEQTDIATVIEAELAEIGITVIDESVESGIFSEKVFTSPDFEMNVATWSPGGSADNAYRGVFHSSGSAQYSNIRSEEVDAMIDDALNELDPEKKAEMYAELQRYLTEDFVAWVPLYLAVGTMAAKADVEGIGMLVHSNHNFANVQRPLN